MKSLPHTLFYSFSACLAFAAVVTLLTLTTGYHPAGVKPHQREAYASKMRETKALNEIAKQADPTATPRVAVDQRSYDFGMVDPHTTLSHEFVVANQGAVPLALEVADTSCKCTVGDLKDSLLPPGEKTTVTLTWNTGYHADHYEQTATISTNDPLAKTFELKVKGEVRAELIAPETVVFKKADLGHQAETKFVVYSQLWDQFSVSTVDCDLDGFEWHAEPIETSDARLADTEAKSACEVSLFVVRLDYGKFSGNISMTIQPGDAGDDVVRQLACHGKVRAPINFYNKDIHPSQGLDIGTVESGQERNFHLVVRSRGDESRQIEVLDVKPDQLQASLEPLSTTGSYRMTVTVPADCPMVMFNGDHKHGYVHVGDPEDKNFSNWFPLLGAVVAIEK